MRTGRRTDGNEKANSRFSQFCEKRLKTEKQRSETVGNKERLYWKPRSTTDCSAEGGGEEEEEEMIRLAVLSIEWQRGLDDKDNISDNLHFNIRFKFPRARLTYILITCMIK